MKKATKEVWPEKSRNSTVRAKVSDIQAPLVKAEFEEVNENDIVGQRIHENMLVNKQSFEIEVLKGNILSLKKVVVALSDALKNFSTLALDDAMDNSYCKGY